MTQLPSYPTVPTHTPSPLFAQVLREDSNYEMGWLWAATRLIRPEEIRYCLERALYINPESRAARLGLRTLACAEDLADPCTRRQWLSNPLQLLATRLFGGGLF